jgi:ribosome biogenesis protein NSA1
MKLSLFNDEESILVATGGKENDLKVWNLKSDLTEPVFKAKNVADNWIQLREPVWVTCIDFIDKNKVAVGTAYHQVNRIFYTIN